MAPQQESNKDGGAAITPTMEEEEEEEEDDEEEHHRHGERPLLLSANEQDQEDASKPLPLPAKRRRRSSSSLSRSSRSSEQGQEEAAGPGGGARSLSFSRLFSSFRMMATSTSSTTTLDIDELAAAEDGRAALNPQQQQQWKKPVCRTQSMPMTSISRRLPAHGGRKRVADSSSLRRLRVSSLSSAPLPESSSPSPSEGGEEEEEEVGEEEAVCRICMVALLEEEEEEEGGAAAGAGDGVLKLECRCKGELALAHRRCALKWFGIKGNPNCDVCGHDVLNLPVTLRRVAVPPPPPPPPLAAGDNGTGSQEEGGTARRGFNRGVWRHGTVILVTVSMLAYFCFLEQLLVGDHGNAAAALAVSAPFAVVLGTFSALTTAGMASSRRYVWAYSALQFLLVVLFTHLFYRYVRLQPVIAIILSAFAGFGVAICANALLLQAARWRAAARRPPPPPSDLDIPQP